MTPEQWEQVRALFDACDEKSRDEVERLLAEHGDPAVVREVRAILEDPTTKFLIPPAEELTPAQLEDYELGDEIGRGGMGIVRAGSHRSTGRAVAIKLLQVSSVTNPVLAAALRREAIRAFALRHANIVRVLHVGEEDDGPFIVMERVEGPNLRQLLTEARGKQTRRGPLETPEGVAECLRQLAEALDYSHNQRVVHRDVKPSNILLDPEGRPLLTDFGIAKDLDVETATEEAVGTVHYMSPEQAKARTHSIDARTDIYSLAVVGYEMLTLQRPFEGDTQLAILDAIQRSEPEPIRRLNESVPTALANILHKAMRKPADLRYASAKEMAEDLARYLRGETPLAKAPSVAERTRSMVSRHRRIAAIAALLMLTTTVSGLSLWFATPPDPSGQVVFARVASEVVCREVDPTTMEFGDEVTLLDRDCERVELEPGWWWVGVRLADGETSESVVWLENDDEVELNLGLRSDIEDDSNMVLVPGGPAVLKPGLTVDVNDFLIDSTEVTNADYRAFLDALGDEATERRPNIWPEGYDWWTDEIGRLPVVAVSFSDASAYANWVGKRLPTRAEWLRAALRDSDAPFVWGAEADDLHQKCNVAQERRRHPSLDEPTNWHPLAWAEYIAHCSEPRSYPLDQKDSVFDLQGNVEEWVLDPAVVAGEVTEPPIMRTTVGGGFRSAGRKLNAYRTPPAMGKDHGTGFRCVRSVFAP